MNAKENFLSVKTLTKQWPQKTISISFCLKKGESLALLGSSGCGKSTVLKMLAGLVAPDSGSFFLDGKNMLNTPPHKRRIGMMFQDYALFPHLSVEDNIGYGLVSRGMSKKQSRIQAAEWIQRFSLDNMQKRKPDNLSGGEKQRVALARTLAVQPDVVLFDEPLSALDADLRTRLREELRRRQKTMGYTAVYVTHDAAEAAVLADTIMEMR